MGTARLRMMGARGTGSQAPPQSPRRSGGGPSVETPENHLAFFRRGLQGIEQQEGLLLGAAMVGLGLRVDRDRLGVEIAGPIVLTEDEGGFVERFRLRTSTEGLRMKKAEVL